MSWSFNRWLKQRVVQEDFHPSWFGVFTNPFYIARKGLYTHIRDIAPNITGKILDVGCGSKPYRALFDAEAYVGLEIDTLHNRAHKQADAFYDGSQFPFADEQFDSVICNEVLEHVFNPEAFLGEIHRVLKPSGRVLFTVPFVWDEHEQPFDYARYSSFGLTHLLQRHGFEVSLFCKSVNDFSLICQLINAYLFKCIYCKGKSREWILIRLSTSIFNLLGALLAHLLPKNNDLYLDNIVVVTKVSIE